MPKPESVTTMVQPNTPKNQESLKEQLIDAMSVRLGHNLAESVFTCDLWPVLDAAMKAGELLVARNTVPQKPVHEAITAWLEVFIWTVQRVRADENTVSRREVLKLLYDAEANITIALADAKAVTAQASHAESQHLLNSPEPLKPVKL